MDLLDTDIMPGMRLLVVSRRSWLPYGHVMRVTKVENGFCRFTDLVKGSHEQERTDLLRKHCVLATNVFVVRARKKAPTLEQCRTMFIDAMMMRFGGPFDSRQFYPREFVTHRTLQRERF